MPENPLSPSIQTLLAALPELFPGVQKIPLANIRLNPENPGARPSQEEIDELGANIALEGLKNPVKVMPDPAGPLAPGLTPHPDNPRMKADGAPWTIADFRFLNLSGELRQLACQSLQWTEINGFVLNPTAEEAVVIIRLDNKVRNKGWWADYQTIESLIKANPRLTQKEVATRLEMNVRSVNWALSLLPLLNTEARGLIVSNRNNQKKENKGISETTAARLSDLGPGSTFKPGVKAAGESQALYPYPAIPLETQNLVYRTLAVAIDRKMTEARVAKLVEWVQAGNPPETFGSAPKTPPAKKAGGIPPEALDKVAEMAEQLGLAKGRGEDPKPYQDRLNAYLTEVKAGSAPTNPEFVSLGQPHLIPSDPVLSPKGFDLLKRKIKNFHQAVFKTDAGTGSSNPLPPLAPQPGLHHTHQDSLLDSPKTQKEIKTAVHWVKKTGKRIAHFAWHKFIKYEHRFCKEIANEALPEHYTHHRGGKKRGRGFIQDATTLALTLLHWAVYVVCQFVFWWAVTMGLISRFAHSLRPGFEWPFRFVARQVLVNFPAWAWGWAKAPGNWVPALVTLAIALFLINLARKAEPTRVFLLGVCLAAGLYYGHSWGGEIEPETQTTDTVVTPAPQTTPVMDEVKKIVSLSKMVKKPKPASVPGMSANGNINGPLAQPSHVAQLETSQQVYQPAVSFAPSVEDPKILELEIAAFSNNSIAKDFPVAPDESMPGDLAVTRMQSVTDPDKYTMMIGSGKQKILSINTTTTNLTVNDKSTDPFGTLLGDGGPVNIVWEDVTAIHISEIDVETKNPHFNANGNNGPLAQPNLAPQFVTSAQVYQFSLISEGAKYPLTIQCASTDDLRHLVSTMEYFIRNSRLGHDTPLTGMPYPLQGLRLNRDCAVEKLWANSPADKAGLVLGDHLWSIGKITSDQQEKNVLEKGLQSVPTTMFVASDADWNKALIAKNSSMTPNFRPKLRKVVLNAL